METLGNPKLKTKSIGDHPHIQFDLILELKCNKIIYYCILHAILCVVSGDLSSGS